MALQTINIGASANDGSGDPLRTAMDKINDNFEAIAAGEIRVTDLGNLGAAETIDNANGPQQKGTLDASTVITLPAVAASATAWELNLDLVQDSTGGFLPTFIAPSGDKIEWDYGRAPDINTLHTNPTQANRFRFRGLLDTIYATHLNPKDSGLIMSGGSFIQKNFESYIGSATVVTRGPETKVEAEVSTSDDTETTLISVHVPLNTTVCIEGRVLCSKVAGASGYALSQRVEQSAHRSTSGNVTEIAVGGEVFDGQQHGDFPAQAIVFDVDTTNQLLRLRVIGVAATALRWMFYGTVTIQNVPTS